ncbi:MAG TPA: hypothetical protein VEQ60_19240, partial [Longimicrobium sp.]|nr:hypothetical protein [Longimicrobium sp.]
MTLVRSGVATVARRLNDAEALYAISCACVRAHSMADEPHGREAQRLADVFARRSRLRIRQLFAEIGTNADDST